MKYFAFFRYSEISLCDLQANYLISVYSMDNQSVDRAYRIGQKKDVVVYRLMTCGTVEEKIYRKQVTWEFFFNFSL